MNGKRFQAGRDALGMLVEIGLAVVMLGIAAVIAIIATRGRLV